MSTLVRVDKDLEYGGICKNFLRVLRTILGITYLTISKPRGKMLGIAIQKDIPILRANRIANHLWYEYNN